MMITIIIIIFTEQVDSSITGLVTLPQMADAGLVTHRL